MKLTPYNFYMTTRISDGASATADNYQFTPAVNNGDMTNLFLPRILMA